jgi:outer membrane cobalamin receptor
VTARAAAAAYSGNVRDMIVWAPDYRFVWSPRNVDVRRRGVEASLAIEAAGLLRTLRASYGYARIVYADGSDNAQLEYRPRSTAQLSAGWALADWDAGVHARYVGERYPAAARVNALPGFWTVSADLNRTWRTGVWSIRTALHVDRLFDAHDALIFGFPEPGRVGELRVRLSRTNTPGDDRP